jgi:hypothetical protein
MTSELFQPEEIRSTPTPLVLARRRLSEMERQIESINDEESAATEAERSEIKRQWQSAMADVAGEELIEAGRAQA